MTATPLRMDEHDARRVVLAHAIETADAQREVLSQAERDQADMRARQEALHERGRPATDASGFLALRARHVLGAISVRHPKLAALQEPAPWQPWVEWAAPLAALAMGAATDAIGNPHRVDLVSLPLLGIVFWNLWMYLLFFVAALLPRKGDRPSWMASFGSWQAGFGGSDAAAQAGRRFRIDWLRATRPLHLARVQRVLHLSAAAWALGVILSLLVRGLVVEYRVGWESTFLGPGEVHSLLRLLRLPALVIFPFDTFSVVDVAEMRFSNGGGAAAGAPWVWMYVAILVSIVIIPRLLLATFMAWREERLARSVPVEIDGEYTARIESLMNAASFRLGLLSHRAEDRERFLLLLPDRPALPVVVSSAAGDVMRLVDINASEAVPMAAAAPWWARWWPFGRAERPAPGADCDVVLHLAAMAEDVASGSQVLQGLARPSVTIDMGRAGEGIPIDTLARPYGGDIALLAAVSQALPEERLRAFAHVSREWKARVEDRMQRSMNVIANHALFAARQVEEAMAGNLSVRSLLPAEREAQSLARDAAMARIVQRLDESAHAAATQLRALHGVDEGAASDIEHRLEQRFTVQQPVDAPQAGIAGAASGAAMGASIDLLAGGLTLGAAAALGALVGGSAAYIAAAWKNRSSPTGVTVLQLSDDMLDALVEAALLRYVAIAHWARGHRSVDEDWRRKVVTQVEARRPLLAGFWNTARTQPDAGEKLAQPLARELDVMARAILEN